MTNSNNQQAVAVNTPGNAAGKETTKTRVAVGSAFAGGPWRARVSRSLLFAMLGSAAILSATPTVPAGQLGAVQYVTGDFNGDSIADLIVVTASGSYEYLGQSGGDSYQTSGFAATLPWERSNTWPATLMATASAT
jgi:hypothetical protein